MNLEARFELLEKQCRIYRSLFILAGLIAVAVIGYGAVEPIPAIDDQQGINELILAIPGQQTAQAINFLAGRNVNT